MFHILSLSSKNLTCSGVIKVLKALIDGGSPNIDTFQHFKRKLAFRMIIIQVFPFSPKPSYEELLQRGQQHQNKQVSTQAAGRPRVECTAATSYLFSPSVNSCRPDMHGGWPEPAVFSKSILFSYAVDIFNIVFIQHLQIFLISGCIGAILHTNDSLQVTCRMFQKKDVKLHVCHFST